MNRFRRIVRALDAHTLDALNAPEMLGGSHRRAPRAKQPTRQGPSHG